MNSMSDDSTLLRRYAAEKSAEAFAELVRRHLPLVHAAALRRLGGDAHRAEDVAQLVFCAVARHAAGLARHPSLAGWLYTATRNEVIDLVRAENRRRTRERLAQTMNPIAQEPETAAEWSQLRPVLDSAMDQLDDRDREAVLLRFFQGLPFAEVGRATGLREDAARKRVERALDRLRTHLRPHGINSPAAALATLLAQQSVGAVPPGLAATVTGGALAAGSAAATGVTTLFALGKLQVGLAVMAAGGAVAVVTQHRSIATLREENAALHRQVVALRATEAAPTAAPGASTPGSRAPAARATRVSAPVRGSILPVLPEPNPYVTPRAELPLAPLPPLPASPEIESQKADLHRRYGPFLAERGLTTAQRERFVELLVQQGLAREDLQASVRAAGASGGTSGIERLRSQLYAPITRELHELLGADGYQAYTDYMRMIFYRDGFVARLVPEFNAAAAGLSAEQIKRLIEVVAAQDRPERVRPTDIGTRSRIDWDAVVGESRGFLDSRQVTVLADFAGRQAPTPP
jgi:RNA polymerase sigma factor (sigma-70 family)